MSGISENDQKILNHLTSFLGQGGNPIIKQCLTEMLKPNPNIRKIITDIEPYRDDAILVLIEALNLSGTESFIIKTNAIRVLEKIGTHKAVSLILENFNQYINRFNFSFTKMLTIIATREGEETKRLVNARYIEYLINENNSSSVTRGAREKIINSILDSFIQLNIFDDPRWSDLLEKYIRQSDENTDTHQLALSALAKVHGVKATAYIDEKIKETPGIVVKAPKKKIRVVYTPIENKVDNAFITLFESQDEKKTFLDLFTKKNTVSKPDETPDLFEFENPLIYFLADGTQNIKAKLLVGRAENREDAINVAIQYLETKSSETNIPESKFQECNKLLAKHFDFEHWGFRQSFIQPSTYPTIIYDSEWCRIKFVFDSSGDRFDFKTHLHIYYGRLHAPGGDSFMLWNGEKCWCWHRVDYALNFLDGLSPEEAVKVEFRPQVIEQYRQSDLAKELSAISQAEWLAGMESEIWKQYGKRLFEIFDLRRPELWEQYSGFMQEFYKIKKSESFGLPARDKIC